MPPAQKGRTKSSGLTDIIAITAQTALEQRLLSEIREGPIPRHLGIIMDGNRRFAREHGLLTEEGHLRGKDKLEELLDWCLEVGIKVLTVYALSTENLNRPPEEVDKLMELFVESFHKIAEDPRVHRHRIHVNVIGDRAKLRADVVKAIEHAEARTADYGDYWYNIAVAYGGREEIIYAIRKIAREVKEGKVSEDEIDEKMVAKHLYTPNMPDPDLIFRTSGEERISNFLLWQVAYAELYFSDVLWPGLRKLDFLRAIHDYQRRQRRYGT